MSFSANSMIIISVVFKYRAFILGGEIKKQVFTTRPFYSSHQDEPVERKKNHVTKIVKVSLATTAEQVAKRR